MPLSAFSVVRVTGQGRRGTVDDQAARGEEETVEHLLNSSHSITSSLIKSRVFGGSRDPATPITAQATRRRTGSSSRRPLRLGAAARPYLRRPLDLAIH